MCAERAGPSRLLILGAAPMKKWLPVILLEAGWAAGIGTALAWLVIMGWLYSTYQY